MQRSISRPRLVALWACAGLVAAASGCGTSEYNALTAKRANTLYAQAPFRSLYGPTPLDPTPLSIRVPTVFSKAYYPDSPHPLDGPKINPQRVQPPFLEIPGLKVCYEGTFDLEGRRLPFYCYLAAVPGKAGDADKLAAELQAELKKKFPSTPDGWEDVQADTQDGSYIAWKKIRVTADQSFLVQVTNPVPTDVPGDFELWIHELPDYVVLVGWRSPSSIDGPIPDAGKGAPEPKRPDFTKMPKLTAGTLSVGNAAPGAAETAQK
jgi:hypothetical protein